MNPFNIVSYDPQWSVLFQYIKIEIIAALRDCIVGIEHIGSTAVPDLAAKPILDIMIGVSELSDADLCIPQLVSLGYEYAPEHEAWLPYRRHFRKYGKQSTAQHLHIVEHAQEYWERHLLFRDYLRTHPSTAKQYLNLKRELAKSFDLGSHEYTAGKWQFVTSIENLARSLKQQQQ